MCYGSVKLEEPATGAVRVRFHNDGGRKYARCEAHLVYQVPQNDGTKVTFTWSEDGAEKSASHRFDPARELTTWSVPTGQSVKTRWVEFATVK